MPLDITLFRREGGNPEAIRESQRRRYADVNIVDEIISKDDLWRSFTGKNDHLRKARNAVQKEIGNLKKQLGQMKGAEATPEYQELNTKCEELINEKNKFDKEIEDNEILQKQTKVEVDILVNKVGNIVHDNVPVGNNEDEGNRVERRWGTPRDPTGLLNHHDLLWRIGGYEPERGANVAGHRGYFLRDVGVLLNQAFINYGIAFLRKRDYCVVQPPFMMRKDVMAGVAQLEQFDEELYKVLGETEDKYLIATSEQPICAYHKDEWMDEKALPLLYAGISTCFRKEAGSHGKDTWGIFRVHQFEKVEQFAIVEDDLEKSNAMQEEMIRLAEEFYQSFGFPYQVINIVSGALNNAAIRKYDLEAWFPGYNNYRELVSCSNCTDYQSRAMEIRCGQQRVNQTKRYVHMLNATLCATGRAICCLLENYQEKDGVRIPEVLVPFMGGITFLPFVRDSKLTIPTTPATTTTKTAATTITTTTTTTESVNVVQPSIVEKTETVTTEEQQKEQVVPLKKEKKENKKEKKSKDTTTTNKVKGSESAATAAATTAITIAPIPDVIKPPPAYVSAAPLFSTQSQLVSTSTQEEVVPGVLQIVSLTNHTDIVTIDFLLLNQRLKYYTYVGGDRPNQWDRR
jgi:seryl-tRNA synthetase